MFNTNAWCLSPTWKKDPRKCQHQWHWARHVRGTKSEEKNAIGGTKLKEQKSFLQCIYPRVSANWRNKNRSFDASTPGYLQWRNALGSNPFYCLNALNHNSILSQSQLSLTRTSNSLIATRASVQLSHSYLWAHCHLVSLPNLWHKCT